MRKDTTELLKVVNSGAKMGVNSLSQIKQKVRDERLKGILTAAESEHEQIKKETREMLREAGFTGEVPTSFAKLMSELKTGAEMAFDGSDSTAAGLITDGCNMGIKSTEKALNDFSTAEREACDIAKKLIRCEQSLLEDVKEYL